MTAFSHQQGVYKLDWFGKAENFDADLATLSEHLGVDIPKAENQNVNVAPRSGTKYLGKYDRATAALVNDLYKDDFEFFGYEPINPFYFPEHALG